MCSLANRLSDSEAALQLAGFDVSEVNLNTPTYKSSVDAWQSELHRLGVSNGAKTL